jgi:hypothetical protein
MSTEKKSIIRVIGDSHAESFTVVDTIDGVTFARASLHGNNKITRKELGALLGDRAPREKAYHALMEPIILSRCTDNGTKLIMQKYIDAKIDLDVEGQTRVVIDELRRTFDESLKGITTRDAYINVLGNKQKFHDAVLKHANNLSSLTARFVIERSIVQFSKIYEKHLYSGAPTDKEINNAADVHQIVKSAFNMMLDAVSKEAIKNGVLKRSVQTLTEFAKINSY